MSRKQRDDYASFESCLTLELSLLLFAEVPSLFDKVAPVCLSLKVGFHRLILASNVASKRPWHFHDVQCADIVADADQLLLGRNDSTVDE